jgi:hypothetical protein
MVMSQKTDAKRIHGKKTGTPPFAAQSPNGGTPGETKLDTRIVSWARGNTQRIFTGLMMASTASNEIEGREYAALANQLSGLIGQPQAMAKGAGA